jgi:flagellar motor switch/type III secretory pathway protein FliN
VLSVRPNFSPFPFSRLRRLSRRDAAGESAIARWLDARSDGAVLPRLEALLGTVRVRLVGTTTGLPAHAALATFAMSGVPILVAASPAGVRRVAQHLLGGPPELPAPRPPTPAEHAIWALVVAAALADLGITAEVTPLAGEPELADAYSVELAVEVAGGVLAAIVRFPAELVVRLPPRRSVHPWSFDLPIVVARCALAREAVAALAVRDVITVEPNFGLVVGDATVRLTAAPRAVEASVASGYVRTMPTPDDAHLELTVQLGTTRLSLRQLGELAVGQIIPLGRPLAGPYEIHAAGRPVGEGELVDVDGELGVRIVSLIQE